jgi:hypothetical protein
MSAYSFDNPDCYYGDHYWNGGGTCSRCGMRLRCDCGQFVTEDGMDEHFEWCPHILKLWDEIEERFPPSL